MSLHPTLKGSTKIRVRRNVLKRFERINTLMESGKFDAEKKKVFGLPKTKGEI